MAAHLGRCHGKPRNGMWNSVASASHVAIVPRLSQRTARAPCLEIAMKTSVDTVGIKVACRVLDVTESAVRRMILAGKLTAVRDDQNRRRFLPAELKRLAKQRAAR